MDIYLLKKYVDDVNLAMFRIVPCMRWELEPGEIPRLIWAQDTLKIDM